MILPMSGLLSSIDYIENSYRTSRTIWREALLSENSLGFLENTGRAFLSMFHSLCLKFDRINIWKIPYSTPDDEYIQFELPLLPELM